MGAYLGINMRLDHLEKQSRRPVTLRFRLPLPGAIQKKYGLPPRPAIQHVILAGYFSDWNPNNTNFRMTRKTNGSWEYSLRLYPGLNPYKFVIHLKDTSVLPGDAGGLVWCPDSREKNSQSDAFGGKNSLHIISSVSSIRRIVFWIFLILLGGLLLLPLLVWIMRLLMTRRISLKYKLLTLFVILILTASSFFVILGQNQQKEILRDSMIDRINLLHGFLHASGIRFRNLHLPGQRDKARKLLRDLMYSLGTRTVRTVFSNTKQQIDNIFLLSPEGIIYARAMVENAEKYVRHQLKTKKAIRNYYSSSISNIFRHMGGALRRERRLFSLDWNHYHNKEPVPGIHVPDLEHGIFGHDTFLLPVYMHDILLGFYLARINPELFSTFLTGHLLINLLLSFVLLSVFIVIIRKLGDVILEPVIILKEGLKRIMDGDLNYSVTLDSNDELYQLGIAYNYMRLGLIEANVLKDQLLRNANNEARQLADALVRRDVVHKEVDRSRIVYSSRIMHEVVKKAEESAAQTQPVLVTGETGTGKELIARLLHSMSRNASRPFVAINCSAIPDQLWEDEIFGHVRGAFTDARADRAGKLEEAGEGTLFFDEIGEMPPGMQVKLLRVLQEREYYRIGSSQKSDVLCRFLFATNRNLESMIEQGGFRRDLYYRINVFHIHLPPLRERREDIPEIANHLINRYSSEVGVDITQIEERAIRALQEHDWPGNIRELENVIIRGLASRAARREGTVLTRNDLSPDLHQVPPAATATAAASPIRLHEKSFQEMVDSFMREIITTAISEADGNRSKAARILGLRRGALLYRMKELGIE